jgi:hypothetical protein
VALRSVIEEREQMMDTTPVLTVSDDPPFVDRVADKVRTLAAVKPALVRLLEWQIDVALSLSPGQPGSSEGNDG